MQRLESYEYDVESFNCLCSRLNCGATPKQVSYSPLGMPLIRGCNVRPNRFERSDLERVAELEIEADGNKAILPHDILFTMSGVSLGDATVYPADSELASFSNTVARGRVSDPRSTDPYWVMLFLNSSLGRSQTNRLSSGGVLGHVMPNSVRELRILLPSCEIQKAIGLKARAANRLRALSAAARANVKDWLASRLPEWPEPREELDVRPSFDSSFTPDRFDPWFNHVCFHELDAVLQRTSGLAPLSEFASAVSDRWSATTDQIQYIEIGSFDLIQGTVSGKTINADQAPSRAKIACQPGDVAVALVRPNRKNIAFVHSVNDNPLVVTSGCEVLRFGSEEEAAFYSIALRQNIATYQIMKWNTGTSYPAVDQLRAEEILVPRIPDSEREGLLSDAMLAVGGVERANRLVRDAAIEVEQLLDGSFDKNSCLKMGESLSAEFNLEDIT